MVGTQNELMEWGRVVLVFFQQFLEKIGGYLPQVLGAIIILADWLARSQIIKRAHLKSVARLWPCGTKPENQTP